MAGSLNAKVIVAKCSKTRKGYGIRIEQRGALISSKPRKERRQMYE
jgi:hypothetical protein